MIGGTRSRRCSTGLSPHAEGLGLAESLGPARLNEKIRKRKGKSKSKQKKKELHRPSILESKTLEKDAGA